MHPPLQLRLFGSPNLTNQGQPLNGFISGKVRGLLIYLAATARPHSRDHLAQLLWEDTPASMKVNLRKALSNLRQIVGDLLLEDGKDSIWLDSQRVWVDVIEFGRLSKESSPQEAVELYQADFLSGFNLSLSYEFEAWALSEQSHLKSQMVNLLRKVASQAEHHGYLYEAISTVRRLLELEPWHEDIHRWLMQLLAKNGQRGAVLAHFEICKKVLRQELDAEPSAETVQLLQILIKQTDATAFHRGTQPLHRSPITTSPFIVGPPITQPHHFLGRQNELGRIFGWWQNSPMAHVALIGPRRSGKTSLLLHLQALSRSATSAPRDKQTAAWLSTRQPYRWVWVDFQDPRMRQQGRLLRHLLLGFGMESPADCSLETFMDIACSQLWQQPVIVLMDELSAGLAAPELDQAFWWALRALTQATDGQLAFAIAAHDSPMRLAEDQGKTSPFFNIFTTLELGPFTNDEARLLINSSPLPFVEKDVAWMLTQSGCWPFLLQILCQERLASLERNEKDERWREMALQRMEPFRYLLDPALG